MNKEKLKILEEIGIKISKKAVVLSGFAKRKTVMAKDIKLARED